MKLSEKQNNIITSGIYLIVFLKVISDIFYQVQIIDIVLTGCAGLLMLYTVFQKKIKLNVCDICILILSVLFTLSFLKDMSYYRDYVKIISGFILYFLGRCCICDVDKVSDTLGKAFLIAFGINVVYCLLGFGTIKWGNAVTYRGTYYFKTDFAAMLSYFVMFFFVKQTKYKWTDLALFLLAVYFTVMANARIFYLIFSIMVGFIILYKMDQKLISVKGVVILFVSAVFGVLMAVIIPKLPIFAAQNMLGFEVDNLNDLFGNSNMQGRNNIWKAVLSSFFKTNFMTQLLGAELSFNNNYGLPGFTEHSLYVKLLINTGFAGLLIWLVFVGSIVYFVWKDRNRKVEYLCAMLLTIFLIQGISVETIAFTDSTWNTMFFCGLLCSSNSRTPVKE